jgi:hypothetical protein
MLLLLDEHLPNDLLHLLRQPPHAFDVVRIGMLDCPGLGAPDPQILIWCEAESAILLTMDRRTVPTHLAAHLAAGRHVPGIIMLDGKQPWRAVVEDVTTILAALEPWEQRDAIHYLPL